MEFYFQGILH